MIDEKDLEKLATLARLEIPPQLAPKIASQISNILAHVNKLASVNTTGVEPLFQVNGSVNVTREDLVVQGRNNAASLQGTLNLEETLSNAPEKSGRFIKTPMVIE